MSESDRETQVSERENEEVAPAKIVKPKRKMSPEHLEKLKAAREKGLATIRANKEKRKAELLEMRNKIKAMEENKLKEEKKKQEPVVKPVKEEAKEESESDDEPIKTIIKKKPKKKAAKRIIYKYESDSSDSEAEIVIKRRSKKTKEKKQKSPDNIEQPPFPEPVQQVRQEPSYSDYLLAEKLKAIRMINPNFRGFGN